MSAETAKKSFGDIAKEYWGYTKNGVKHFIKKDNQIWLSFLLPALIMLISYFAFGVYPIGKQSVLSLDLNGQYIYYYDHMYDVLYGGESIFYSWSRNLSGEWMGIIGYYLGSPFNFIVWLFPRSSILDGMLTMMCVKVGAIGLCNSIYFSRAKNFKKLTTIVFSVCYALCAYTIVQTMNPMWLDGVMILPIICLGIERFVDQGRFRLLVFAWVYAFVTCFYIGYMLAIFSIIYFLLYMVITKNQEAREKFFSKSFKILGLGIVAIMISAFMLIPVYESLSYGKLEFSTPDYSLKENFPLIELFDKIIPNSYDTVRMTGLPFLYCGIITILLLPAYFFHGKIRRSERISYAAVMLILVLCMYIRPVDMIWHGGQMPNWLPYRYSFMLSFLMTVCAASAFDRLREISTKCIGITAAAWFGIMVYQESMDNFVEDLNNGRDTLNNFTTIIPAVIILFTITTVVVQMRHKLNYDLRKNRTKIYSFIILGVVAFEAGYNTIGQIYTQHKDITYSNNPSYMEVIPPIRDKVNEIKAEDDGFYRIEKLFFRTVNDPLATNMYGLSHSSSTLNAKPIALLKSLGFTAKSHYTRYSGATLITTSLFGVKYELTTQNNETADVRNGLPITVTKNEYALPICYLGENAITELKLTQYNPFTAQTELLNTLIGKNYDFYTRITDYSFNPVNITQSSTTDDHRVYRQKDTNTAASLTYNMVAPKSGKLYMYLPSTYERAISITVNGQSKGKYFEGDNNYMKLLGEFNEGDHVDVVLKLERDVLYFREAEFAVIDEEAVKTALNELKEINKDTVCTRPNATTVRTEMNCEKDMTFFTTVPVEKGWSVYVDGVKTDYVETVDALISVPLTAGKHTVEMKFTTAGYPAAVIISIAGIMIFVGLIVLWLKKNPEDRKRRKEHIAHICSGEAYKELKAIDKADCEERKRINETDEIPDDEKELWELEEEAAKKSEKADSSTDGKDNRNKHPDRRKSSDSKNCSDKEKQSKDNEQNSKTASDDNSSGSSDKTAPSDSKEKDSEV